MPFTPRRPLRAGEGGDGIEAHRRLLQIAVTAVMVIGALFATGTPVSAEERSPAGTWVGTYTCRQGLTGLRLDIAVGEGNSLDATFAFYAIDSNPDVPSGKFTMRGTYSDAGIELIQDTWVRHPAGYEMVDLRSGPFADGDTSLAGKVITDGCTTFSLERDTHSGGAGAHKGSGTAVTGPDLQPTGIKYDVSTIRPDNTVHFDAGIKNNGQEKTRTFNVKWLVDGEDVGAYGSHAGIPGGTAVLDGNSQFDWTPKEAGAHEITFTIDTDNHVAETKESNNSESVTVTVEGSKSTLAFENPLRGGDHAPSFAGYGVANKSLKSRPTCYGGKGHLFNQLSHAGEDWFRAVGTPVYPVAKGKVFLVREWDNGDAIIVEHQLPAQQPLGKRQDLFCLPPR
jgi:CARDB